MKFSRDTSPLWAISSYFNPAGFRNRLRNYRVFRESLNVPLVTVEASFDGRFELGEGDADVLVQLRCGSILWQKERLLNIALSRLPPECRAVAWVDCDVLIDGEDWPSLALEALEAYRLVHLFRTRHDLPPESNSSLPLLPDESTGVESVASRIARGHATAADFGDNQAGLLGCSSRGYAWVARRGLLERHGFYDACILGGADLAILCAAVGRFELPRSALRMSVAAERHYLTWARPFHESVQSSVGYINVQLFHLWHGTRENRRVDERFEILKDANFDPTLDIAMGDQGCWVWNSNKPDLHARINAYFRSRNEDGLPSKTEYAEQSLAP